MEPAVVCPLTRSHAPTDLEAIIANPLRDFDFAARHCGERSVEAGSAMALEQSSCGRPAAKHTVVHRVQLKATSGPVGSGS
jgi:hypothetical protein